MKLAFIFPMFFVSAFFGQTSPSYQPPRYSGGNTALTKYLSAYLSHPALARESKQNLDITATIHVSKTGTVKYVSVLGSPDLKNDAKRVLTLSPTWLPASRDGQPIDTMVVKKIYFSLDDARAAGDTTIAEIVTYQVALTKIEGKDLEKKMMENAEKRKIAEKYFQEGNAEFAKNNLASATTLFLRAEAEGMTNIDLYYNLGISYLKQNQPDAACRYLAEAGRKGDAEAYSLYIKNCR